MYDNFSYTNDNIDQSFVNSVIRLNEVYNRIIQNKYDGSPEFVEKFLDQLDGAVLVIEQAGYPSIEACFADLFEQNVQALGLTMTDDLLRQQQNECERVRALDTINADTDAVETLMQDTNDLNEI